MSNYTPGPWEVFSYMVRYPGIETERGDFSIIVYGEDEEESGVQGWTKEESVANANLIAAAPELLEALEKAVEIIDGEFGEGAMTPVMKQALAKARGEDT